MIKIVNNTIHYLRCKRILFWCTRTSFILLLSVSLFSCQEDRAEDSIDFIHSIEDDMVILESGTKHRVAALQDSTKKLIVLVRHAEKDTMGMDPGLSDLGKARAVRLVELFNNVPIANVYTTHFKRSSLTVYPLAIHKEKEYEYYDSGDLDFHVENQFEKNLNENIFIVAHSNTVNKILNMVLMSDNYKPLNEKEYSKLFMISIDELFNKEVFEFDF